MKLILSILFFTAVINGSYAANNQNYSYMTKNQQETAMIDISKDIRKRLWQSGYEDVESTYFLVEKNWLDDYVKNANNSNYERSLDRDEISELYKCFYGSACQLYYVSVSSNYWGGYGQEGIFVLLYTKSGKNWQIAHTVYAE